MPPLIVLGIAWLGGIAYVALWQAPPWLAALTILALVPATLTGWIRLRWWVLVASAGLAFLGGWQHSAWIDSDLPSLASHRGESVLFDGKVSGLPQPGTTVSRHVIDVDTLRDGDDILPVEGKVLITLGEYAEFPVGTRLRVKGDLEEAPQFPDFDYRGYLERQGIVGTMFFPEVDVVEEGGWGPRRLVAAARLSLEDGLQRALPEPEASLASGIVLGRDGNIPDALYERYRRSGLAHIIAVSGSNVALLTGMVFLAFVPLVGRNVALWPAIGVSLVYLVVAGADASVLRATIMAIIFLAGVRLGRQQAGIAAVAVAAFALTVLQPERAADLGFQLSLAATAGLLVFAPWIEWAMLRALRPIRGAVPPPLVQVSSWTVAATVATAPLLWLNFGELSIVGLLANLLVEPLFAVALLLSLLTAVAGVAWEPAGWAIGIAAWYPLAFINWLATTLGGPEWASVHVGGATGTSVAIAYVVLIGAGTMAYLWPPPESPFLPEPPWLAGFRRYALAAGAGTALVALCWCTLLPLRGPGVLRVDILDVGQGDAILVTTPGGERVLVDGGPSGIVLARELGATLPHWARSIDRAVLTHPQQDHLAGLVELERRFDVGVLVSTSATNPTETYGLLKSEAGRQEQLAAGDSFRVDGVLFTVMWPPPNYVTDELNNTSLVLAVEYGGRRILLTGDLPTAGQRGLLETGADLAADVLKVPHHGAATNDPSFFAAVDADVAIITVGEGNRYGHPRGETLASLEGSTVLRTDTDGRVTIEVSSDGGMTYRHAR